MAELPRVEQFRRYISKRCIGLRINAFSAERSMLLRGNTLPKLRSHLVGQHVFEIQRHGKMLFFRLDSGWLYLHFGPMGYPVVAAKPADDAHSVLCAEFPNGLKLQLINHRRIGEFGWVADKEKFLHSRSYGPDALQVTREEFLERIRRRRAGIKAVLTNQDMIAGIGNGYADEILFRSGLHPHLPVSDLTDEQLNKVYDQLQVVLRTAVHSRRAGTLFFVVNRKEGLPCPKCGTPIRKKYVMGRSAYYCPSCQP